MKKKKLSEIFNKVRNVLRPAAIRYLTRLILRRIGVAAGGILGFIIPEILKFAWGRWVSPLLKRIRRKFRKDEAQRRADDVTDADSEDEFNDSVDRLP